MTVRIRIHGTGVDEQGRCAHYHSERDVIANWCVTCRKWWACFSCHREHAEHPFGRVAAEPGVTGARCGACGHEMDYAGYSGAAQCPRCGHHFNPGCALHAPLYFEV